MAYFQQKNVLITGASSGIGEALALQLARQGANLLLTARRTELLDKLAEQCLKLGASSAISYKMDVVNVEDREGLLKELETRDWKLDVLINNAGVSQRSLTFETSPEVDRKIMEVNFFAPVELTKQLQPFLKDGAHLVVISSISGLFGFQERSTYAASKHAIKGFFESLQTEESPYHVSIICPGRIKSNISVHALSGDGKEHGIMDEAQSKGMDTIRCANKILSATARKKPLVLIGGKELLLYYIKKLFPPLFYIIARSVKPNT